MKFYSKKHITNMLYVLIPIILGVIVSFFLNVSFFFTTGVFYGVVLFFLLPTTNFGFLDFNTKQINPTYRPEKKIDKYESIIPVILIVTFMVLFMILTYFEAKGHF